MINYVDRMIYDSWTEVLCDEVEILMPTFENAKNAVQALDANTKTLVSLYGKDGATLTVGGGAGQYVVYVSRSDDQFLNLIETTRDSNLGVVLLNAGGQVGDFPARQVIALPKVIQAIQAFFQSGSLDASLVWEKQI